MKKIIIGLIAFTSISAFANECKVYLPKHDRGLIDSNFGDRKYERFDNKAIRALNELGYSVTQNENEQTEYSLRRTNTRFSGVADEEVFSLGGNKVVVEVRLTQATTGKSWVTSGISNCNLNCSEIRAEERAMKKAVLNLPPCGNEVTSMPADPTPTEVKVSSCSESLKLSIQDKTRSSEDLGFATGVTLLSAPFVGAFVAGVPGALAGTGVVLVLGTTALTQEIAKKHRKNILEIFKGAASGKGNGKTKKLWRIAHRKNKAVFKDMTYSSFLQHLHNADISGEACEFRDVPKKKGIIQVLVDQSELSDARSSVQY